MRFSDCYIIGFVLSPVAGSIYGITRPIYNEDLSERVIRRSFHTIIGGVVVGPLFYVTFPIWGTALAVDKILNH